MLTIKFNRNYFLLAILLFFTEVFIALKVNDDIIRPYGGDFLVVILIYCAWKSFFNTSLLPTCMSVLFFSYTVEILQYFQVVKLLGLENNKLARIIIGTSFAWTDILSYTLGIGLVYLLENRLIRKKSNFS